MEFADGKALIPNLSKHVLIGGLSGIRAAAQIGDRAAHPGERGRVRFRAGRTGYEEFGYGGVFANRLGSDGR